MIMMIIGPGAEFYAGSLESGPHTEPRSSSDRAY